MWSGENARLLWLVSRFYALTSSLSASKHKNTVVFFGGGLSSEWTKLHLWLPSFKMSEGIRQVPVFILSCVFTGMMQSLKICIRLKLVRIHF